MLKHHAHPLAGVVDVQPVLLLHSRKRCAESPALVPAEQLFHPDALQNLFVRRGGGCLRHHRGVCFGSAQHLGVKIGIRAGEQPVVQPDLPPGRLLEQIHTAQQRALPAARRTDDRHLLAVVNGGTHTLEHMKAAEVLVQFTNVDHPCATSFPSVVPAVR